MARPGLPICLVTGFLGAGKTTLLNHILRNREGLRALVFVNEFGAVDIDGSLIRWQGQIDEARVVTLDNGCICCEVNADLGRQLRQVVRQRGSELDFVVIETSGVCDPGPVLATLERLDDLSEATHLDTVIAMVDAGSLSYDTNTETASWLPEGDTKMGLSDTAYSQLLHSDIILLNKCDLLGGVDSSAAAAAEKALQCKLMLRSKKGDMQISENLPRILRTEHAAADLALITSLPLPGRFEDMLKDDSLGIQRPAKRRRSDGLEDEAEQQASPNQSGKTSVSLAAAWGKRRHSNLRAGLHSFVYTSDRPFDPLKFEAWLEDGGLPRSIFRAKGLLWMHGIPRHVIFQLAGSRTNPFETLGGPAPSDSKIVFIGAAQSILEKDKAKIYAGLNDCLCAQSGVVS